MYDKEKGKLFPCLTLAREVSPLETLLIVGTGWLFDLPMFMAALSFV